MVKRTAILCRVAALLLAVLSCGTNAGHAEDVAITVGVAREARLSHRGDSLVFGVEARDGDYLAGLASISAGSVDIDLVGKDGRHMRRLADGAVGATEFRFVVGADGVRLKATAREDGSALALTLDKQVTVAEQAPPARSYLSPTIATLAAHLGAGGGTDDFWREVATKGTPLVEPAADGNVVVTFLVRGARRNVRLFGAPSNDHEQLERLGGSDIWFKSFTVPDTTRLSYQIAPDVPDIPGTERERRVAILATAQADPFNRHPWPADAPDRYNQDSLFELPDAPPQPGLEPHGAPQGTLSEFRIASEQLGNERTITVYRPNGFDPSNPENVLLFVFDAKQYLTKVPTPTILDNLIATGRIPPVVAVFVSEIDRDTRARELPANPAFADFMAQELLPRVRRETGLSAPAARTVLAGSSYGGLAAATVALRHPQAFGNVISLSGSFWWHPAGTRPDEREHVASLVASNPRRDVRFHLTAGLFETAHGGTAGILETSRHLRDVLVAKSYPVTYREYAGGHDYIVWRGALADGLIALFSH